jgi:hypothetical protein
MSVEQSKKVLHDFAQIIEDGEHANIFHLLSDFKSLSEDEHGVLPELKSLSKEDALELAEASYELIKTIIGVFASV